MDDKRFDGITQALASERSRRRMVGGLIGGVAALLGGATALEAKKGGKGRGRGRRNNGNGNGNGNGGGNGNGNGGGAGTEKVQICHRNRGKKRFRLITVGQPAAAAHERHGDELCETEDVCTVVTGCDDDGACVFGPAEEGTECEVEGEAGVCDAEGGCVTEEETP